MGAGQIGGIATLLDIDFQNAAGFLGKDAELMEAQFIVYFLSHTMMFCVGSLIEPHVILTPASCVFAEKFKFEVYAGSHHFLQEFGNPRSVVHICLHRGFNSTGLRKDCATDNIALLVISKPYSASEREPLTEYVINRVRYGGYTPQNNMDKKELECHFYGWGSRRNGYLIPLLISLRRVDVTVIDSSQCLPMFNWQDKFLCMSHFPCRMDKYGALCPDDLGSPLVCHGFLRGMMISRLIDRPCGIGFIDLAKYTKFLTCGVDDARDVLVQDDYMEFGSTTIKFPKTLSIATAAQNTTTEMNTRPLIITGGGSVEVTDRGAQTREGRMSVTHSEPEPVPDQSVVTDNSKRRRRHQHKYENRAHVYNNKRLYNDKK
ncbi:kallikrein-1-like [Hyposmocoma kahamanoa]|uniref:kallikrein-1-like n=1 Tax=Hyposmocoma kahamanoa TaxID=1477025 RepID=UPI000E6D7560|nr:kallikrein-1-like [Hyposmocoma kahamanoa]